MTKIIKCDSMELLLKIINETINSKMEYIWRGQVKNWTITSSLYRHFMNFNTPEGKRTRLEDHAIDVFRKSLMFDFKELYEKIIRSKFEAMLVMQHYGCPTRLIDWSMSPYIALFFAVESANDSCFLYKLNLTEYQSKIKDFLYLDDYDGEILNFLPDSVLEYLLDDKNINFPIPIAPEFTTNRELAQQTAMLLDLRFNSKIETSIMDVAPSSLEIIQISNSIINDVINHLNAMNIDSIRLFDSIEGRALYAKNQISHYHEKEKT
ncbi:MAG: FRG domain-containing protein [candidate division Zixibacteria bacterium]|nr:FRG domain-containing protein [candidate division Zixibacteria bacterium]